MFDNASIRSKDFQRREKTRVSMCRTEETRRGREEN